MHVGVSAIDGKTIGVLAFVGVHEDAIGDVRVIEVSRIDAAGVGGVIERAVVDEGSAGYRSERTTAIEIDETTCSFAAVEGAVGDGDITQLVGYIGSIYGASGVGCVAKQEQAVINSEIEERVASH